MPRLALLDPAAGGGLPRLGSFRRLRPECQTDRHRPRHLISKALSSDTSQVSIGQVNGALSSDVEIRDIAALARPRDGVLGSGSDRNPPRPGRAAPWLLLRRPEVDRQLRDRQARDPAQAGPATGGQRPPSNEPILPELPLKVILRAFQLNELALSQPVIGVAARFGATGAARPRPAERGARPQIETRGGSTWAEPSMSTCPSYRRTAAAQAASSTSLRATDLKVAGLPGEPPSSSTSPATARSTPSARTSLTAGPTIGAERSATLARAGVERQLALRWTHVSKG